MATFDVIMPVKNGIDYLSEAINSIVEQTFKDWRMFILDHNSTDGSLELARKWAEKDRRIKVIEFPSELSFSDLLNAGIDLCDAKYVLRQDADDLSLPNRMQVIASAFEADAELVLLGSQGNIIDSNGRHTGCFKMPKLPEEITSLSLFRIPVLHPAAALRLRAVQQLGVRYGKDFIQVLPTTERLQIQGLAEDYFMFGQLALTTRCRNVNQKLINFRWHSSNISKKKSADQLCMAVQISRNLARSFAILKNVPEFDPAPMCNHGHKLINFKTRENFSPQFAAMRESLLRGLGQSAALEKELAFRFCLARRNPAAMLGRYVRYVARHGTDMSEWWTIKSWISNQAKMTYFDGKSSDLACME